jgi:XRE family transcriptional regulator, regulator of sulfur utilization
MKRTKDNTESLLGQRIRSLRDIKGWTQQELGSQADVNYKFIGEIERGQQNPSFNTLVKISTALGVELPELFRFEDEITDRKEIENRIITIIKAVSDENIGKILLMLRVLYPIQ